MLWLAVLLPVLGALAAARLPRYAHHSSIVALVATAGMGLWAAATEAATVASWGPRLELTLAAVDFARVMVVLVPAIAIPIVLYAAATETIGRARLVALLTAFVGAMELLVLASDLLTLLIGWELVGALSWILIAHEWRDASNAQQAAHAFITTRFGDLGLYVAAGVVFASTGSFAFSAIAEAAPPQLQVIAAGLVLAAMAKSAQVPFSPWLFSAMAGPTPVSALLHSSTMVAAGAYLLIRLGPGLTSVSWFAPVVIGIGLAGAFGGGLVAAVHRHPKRLLAGSTTAQYGLMFVAIGAGSTVAAGAQLVTHAGFKSLLFLSAGAAIHEAGSDDIADMRLGRRLPLIAASGAVGALALAAIPPLGGAWSKEQIAGAAFESSTLLGAAVVLAGAVSAFYAARFWLLAFGPGSGPEAPVRLSRGSIGPGLLALFSIALGLLWLPRVQEAAAALVTGHVVAVHAQELLLGLGAIAVGAGSALLLERRSQLVQGLPSTALVNAGRSWLGLASLARRGLVAPVLALSSGLARFDDRVIDAGVRLAARIATGLSALLRRRSELSLDAVVDGIAGATLVMATRSRAVDDRGVDRAAEEVAAAFGSGGRLFRRLQTGSTHHYYVIVAAGLLAAGAALALGGS